MEIRLTSYQSATNKQEIGAKMNSSKLNLQLNDNSCIKEIVNQKLSQIISF